MKTVLRLLVVAGLAVLGIMCIKAVKRSRRNRATSLDTDTVTKTPWCKISGTTFEGRQRLLEQLYPKDQLRLARMPVSGHPEGVAVFNTKNEQLGFISIDRGMAEVVSRLLDSGVPVAVCDWERVGGETNKPRLGLRIKLAVI